MISLVPHYFRRLHLKKKTPGNRRLGVFLYLGKCEGSLHLVLLTGLQVSLERGQALVA